MSELGFTPEEARPMQEELESSTLDLIARAEQSGDADIESSVELQQMFAGRPQLQEKVRKHIVLEARRAAKLGSSLEGFLRDSKGTLALMREAKMDKDQLKIYEDWLQHEVTNTTAPDGMGKYLDAISQVGFSNEQIVDGATSLLSSRAPWNIEKFSPEDVQKVAERTETPLETVQRTLMQKIADGRVDSAFLGIGYAKDTKSNALRWRMKLATAYGIPEDMAKEHFARIIDEVINIIPVFLKKRRASGSDSGLIDHIKIGYEAIKTEYPQYADLAQQVLDTLNNSKSPAAA